MTLKAQLKPYLTPLVMSIVAVIFFLTPNFEQYFALQSRDIFSQPWQIFSTHFIHLNTMHLVMNLIGLWLLTILFRQHLSGRILVNVILFSALFATLTSVYIGHDYNFVGLSGVLHGIFAFGAIHYLKSQRKFAFILLFALVAKLAWDMWNADAATTWLDGASIAYWSHLGGALGGVIAVPSLKKRPKDILSRKS